MAKTTDVAIIGGGIIGCSIAYQLSKLGIAITVFERSRFGSGASRAGSGIVGPLWYVDRHNEPLFALGLRSLAMMPGLTGELREAGIDPEFRQSGILKLAFTPENVRTLRDDLAWQSGLGMGARWLQRDEVVAREPKVNPRVIGAAFSPREGCIRAERYVEALVHAASLGGATLLEGVEVAGLETKGGTVIGIRTATETYHAKHTVLAAGPWIGMAGRWLPDELPVRPVKGQRILLRKTGFMPGSVVLNFVGGITPQVDGNVLVGATREEGVFDQRTTADAIGEMMTNAVTSFPTLKDATFVEIRAGVRPGSPDGVPIMGPVPDWEGLSVASGHDHAGIMLSPRSGELMANYVHSGDAGALEPFSLARFRQHGAGAAFLPSH